MSKTDASNNARRPRRMARPPEGMPASEVSATTDTTDQATRAAGASGSHEDRLSRGPETGEGAAQAQSDVAPASTSTPSTNPSPTVPTSERRTKATLVLDLLRREQGATLPEMVDATGWLPHTTRAALTGLRKKGHVIEKSKRDDVTCYRVVEAK